MYSLAVGLRLPSLIAGPHIVLYRNRLLKFVVGNLIRVKDCMYDWLMGRCDNVWGLLEMLTCVLHLM